MSTVIAADAGAGGPAATYTSDAATTESAVRLRLKAFTQ